MKVESAAFAMVKFRVACSVPLIASCTPGYTIARPVMVGRTWSRIIVLEEVLVAP
ncbi:hypothetical protein D3C75_1368580 [compost metagenome]